MIQDLKISLLQFNAVWENPKANHAYLDKYFGEATPATDLIILPEMFSTGFTRDFAEKPPYESLAWMQGFAAKHNADVYGSVAVSENDQFFNRGFWVKSDKSYSFYDKKHLFKFGNEHLTFSSGEQQIRTNLGDWNFKPLICYDLRFPVWSRNVSPFYDVLVYVASWPKARSEAWKSLLKARAIENQCYVIGVNMLGTDGYGLEYAGDSMVIDFAGKILLDCEAQEGRFDTQLSYSKLHDFRQNFPFLNDGDSFTI